MDSDRAAFEILNGLNSESDCELTLSETSILLTIIIAFLNFIIYSNNSLSYQSVEKISKSSDGDEESLGISKVNDISKIYCLKMALNLILRRLKTHVAELTCKMLCVVSVDAKKNSH